MIVLEMGTRIDKKAHWPLKVNKVPRVDRPSELSLTALVRIPPPSSKL